MCETGKDIQHSGAATIKTKSYFWIKDRKEAVHVDLFTDKLGFF